MNLKNNELGYNKPNNNNNNGSYDDSKIKESIKEINSQLEHIAINVKIFGAKGDGLADDTEAFISALNYARGKGRVIVPPGTYRITSTLPFYSNMIMEGNTTSMHISTKEYPMIIFEGESYLFDSIGILDEAVSDYSYIKLGNLRVKSLKDAGGFLAFNRGREFENAPDKPISQGHLLRFLAENLIIEKEVDVSGVASANTNSIAINVVGLMNSMIKNCEFRGWDLALRLHQSDINTFDHCWFVSNLKILESNHLNTYGSQNVFRDCDFEVRRNNTENNWMFEDSSYYLRFDNCYFEIGSSTFEPTSKPSTHPTYNRIKGWFNFPSGRDCSFLNCRWDWIDDFASDCFMNIECRRSLVNFISCSNSTGFNNDSSKKVRVNHMPKMINDYDTLGDYGRVNLISCGKYFVTFFNLEHPNVFISNKNIELDEIKYNNVVYGEKNFIYDYRTKSPSKSGTYDMYYDEKSKKPYVFKLNKLNKKQDQLRFKTILGKNSMFELHKTHNIRIRARSLSDSQNSKIAIRLYHYRGESLIKTPINYNSTINNINYKDFEFKITIDTSYNLNDYIILDILNLDTTNSSTDEFILVEEIQVTDIQNQLYLPTVAQTDIVELKNGSVFFDGNLRTKIDNKIKTNLLVSNYIDCNRSPYSSIVNIDYDTFNSDVLNGRLSIKADGAYQFPSFVEYDFVYLTNGAGEGDNKVILNEVNSFHTNEETIRVVAYVENNTEVKIRVDGTGGSKHLSYKFFTL